MTALLYPLLRSGTEHFYPEWRGGANLKVFHFSFENRSVHNKNIHPQGKVTDRVSQRKIDAFGDKRQRLEEVHRHLDLSVAL
jgi:hypothetical protein